VELSTEDIIAFDELAALSKPIGGTTGTATGMVSLPGMRGALGCGEPP